MKDFAKGRRGSVRNTKCNQKTMWILPNQLKSLISASAQDTEASTLGLRELSATCAQSLTVRGKQPPSNSFSRAWKAGNLMRLQSGLICDPSLGQRFLTEWTSCLVATPASHSAQPVSDLEPKTSGTSGQPSQMEFAFCDHESASSKTSRDTSPLGCEKLLQSWKDSVTARRGEYSARLKLAHLTRESGCLSWPTARTSDCHNSPTSEQSGERYAQLRSAVNWPTATSRDWKGAYSKESHKQKNRMSLLPDMVAHWPTPTTAEAGKIGNQANHGQLGLSNHPALRGEVTREKLEKSRSGPAAQANSNTGGSHQESWATPRCSMAQDKQEDSGRHRLGEQAQNGTTGKLNPRWVEALMGLPIGWVMASCASPVTIAPTSFGCWETESSPQPQPELL